MEISRWLLWRASFFLFVMGFWKRMTVGVRAALVDGDRVLLIKHSYIPGWHFPGGGVDFGETIEEGMRREVMEETGHRVTGQVQIFQTYLNSLPPQRDHVVFFVCYGFEQVETFRPNHEIVACEWFDRHALPAETSKATRARIEEMFGERPRGRTWRD
ncbi:MAG: NUDIX domain-containing protein [Alphaproteobacteria bacterium]|nr:NUDIX domain-containing protein [Alphaproteobacteria bacterium]